MIISPRSAAIFILASSVYGLTVAQDIPTDAAGFTDYVASRLRAEVGESEVRIKGPLTLGVGELQANLDRVFEFCKRNRQGCPDEVSTYVRAAAQMHRDGSAPPTMNAASVAATAP